MPKNARWHTTNLRPPYLGPGQPVFPPLRQMVQVTGPFTLPWLARGKIVQWTPSGARMREDVMVWEPNNIPLRQGAIYRGRLLGSYPPDDAAALPLVGVSLACCVPAGSSSASPRPSGVPSSRSPAASSRAPSQPSSSAIPLVFDFCCLNGLPARMTLTINDLGGCSCLAGTYPLHYVTGQGWYTGNYDGTPATNSLVAACGNTPPVGGLFAQAKCNSSAGTDCTAFQLVFGCQTTVSNVQYFYLNAAPTAGPCSCSPPIFSYPAVTDNTPGVCCQGTISADITL